MSILDEIQRALTHGALAGSKEAAAQPAAGDTFDKIYNETLAEFKREGGWATHPANSGLAERAAEVYARWRTQ